MYYSLRCSQFRWSQSKCMYASDIFRFRKLSREPAYLGLKLILSQSLVVLCSASKGICERKAKVIAGLQTLCQDVCRLITKFYSCAALKCCKSCHDSEDYRARGLLSNTQIEASVFCRMLLTAKEPFKNKNTKIYHKTSKDLQQLLVVRTPPSSMIFLQCFLLKIHHVLLVK